ncbi:MAG: hypothetical protein IPG92_12560 [Flavobacteriales bacterium]|nr:hypothetical protein [Flavobacteriales bacterium]
MSPPATLNGGTNTIQSMQGFFLKAGGPAVTTTVDEATRCSTAAASSAPEGDMALRLRITSTINAFRDEAVVMLHAGTPALEEFDAMKLYYADNRAPQVATSLLPVIACGRNAYSTDSVVNVPLA